MRALVVLGLLSLLLTAPPLHGASPADIDDESKSQGIVDCNEVPEHNPNLAGTPDILVCFEAYISNFDSDDDDNGDGQPDVLGVPHWVAQEVKKSTGPVEGRKRPRAWFTVPDLQHRGIAPTDASYKFSENFRKSHRDWYDRGHMAQKYLAERLGKTAGWFTHNVANAVPQRSKFNSGAWQALECYTGALANKFTRIWIVTGPIFLADEPRHWLREPGREAMPVAIPDALFKIVFRRNTAGKWDAIAFIYPQDDLRYKKRPWNPASWLSSISRIETLTGQAFPAVDAPEYQDLRMQQADGIWPVDAEFFDVSCRKYAKDIQ